MKCECKRCGHIWRKRLDDPAQCPKCKSYKWDEVRKDYSPEEIEERKKVLKELMERKIGN